MNSLKKLQRLSLTDAYAMRTCLSPEQAIMCSRLIEFVAENQCSPGSGSGTGSGSGSGTGTAEPQKIRNRVGTGTAEPQKIRNRFGTGTAEPQKIWNRFGIVNRKMCKINAKYN